MDENDLFGDAKKFYRLFNGILIKYANEEVMHQGDNITKNSFNAGVQFKKRSKRAV